MDTMTTTEMKAKEDIINSENSKKYKESISISPKLLLHDASDFFMSATKLLRSEVSFKETFTNIRNLRGLGVLLVVCSLVMLIFTYLE